MTIVAKPVLEKRFWILRKDDKKIGAIEADNGGYILRLRNEVKQFKTIPMVRKTADIEFAALEKATPPKKNEVYGFATGCKAYNAMWDVKHKLPLFTKERKSKSWYAAGWYVIKQHRNWRVYQNPKLIVLERYEYKGPFYSEEQASDKCI
jgi:hypothetical protein